MATKKKKKQKKGNPFRIASWGYFTYEVLEEISKDGSAATVSEICAAIQHKVKLSKHTKVFADPAKLRKKTYFALWEMIHTKKIAVKVSKRGKEICYHLQMN